MRVRFLLLVKLVASANLSVWEFQQLLGQHHIERHYNEIDLAEDIETIKAGY